MSILFYVCSAFGGWNTWQAPTPMPTAACEEWSDRYTEVMGEAHKTCSAYCEYVGDEIK